MTRPWFLQFDWEKYMIMQMITSKNNAKVKHVVDLQKHAKARTEQKAYVIEGLKMFEELPRESIIEVYASSQFANVNAKLLRDLPVEEVSESVFAQMSDTKTPQGILCVVKQPEYGLDDLLTAKQPFLLVLEDLQDPGNVGTIFRTAEGAGVDGIILSKNCVDVYNPKVVRGAMGSLARVPFLYEEDLAMVVNKLKGASVATYAAHLDGNKMYDTANYKEGCAFLIGNEGNGLSNKLAASADELVKIPMGGEVESLNAAIAATILMYECARQRRS